MGSPTASTSALPSAVIGPGGGSGSGDDPPRKPPRKLNRSANQLHRNQACLTCRRRRIKCDAARPHCSSCVRSFRFLARTQPDPERDARGVQCVYENNEPDEPEEEDPRAAVAKLEARVAELQGELDRLTSRSPSISTTPIFPSHPQQQQPHPDQRPHTSPSIPHTSPPLSHHTQQQHLFPQSLWPGMDLETRFGPYDTAFYGPAVPHQAPAAAPHPHSHPHPHAHPHPHPHPHSHPHSHSHPHGHATSPSAPPEPLAWTHHPTPFHLPDGRALDLELDAGTHPGPGAPVSTNTNASLGIGDDAMSRYVEMSMGMAGMGGGGAPASANDDRAPGAPGAT